jgi:hypothetical protein
MQGQSWESGSSTALVESAPKRRGEFVSRLDLTRHEMHRFLFARAVERVALLMLAGAGILVFADWLLVLGPGIRAAGLLAGSAAALFFFYRWALAPRRFFGKTDAAAEVETTFPALGQQVRTALEYAEPTPATAPAMPGLVNALTEQTDQRTAALNLASVIPWRSLRALAAVGIALVVVYGWLLVSNAELRIAAARLFLVPVHYTQLKVEPGDQTLKAGDDLAIQATLTGRAVRNVLLQFRTPGNDGQWTAMPFVSGDRSEERRVGKEC